MRKNRKYIIPDAFQNLDKWETNRRTFLRSAIVAGAASQIALFTSCSADLEKSNEYLSAEQNTILKSIINILWPDDGNGPSAEDLNTFRYIMWVMGDTLWSPNEPAYITEGLDWVNDTALDLYAQNYFDLTKKEQEALVEKMAIMDFGENWLSVMVTLVMESLLLDPIYGGNKNEAGWNWLEHVPGQPRPDEKTRVESFLEKYKPNEI